MPQAPLKPAAGPTPSALPDALPDPASVLTAPVARVEIPHKALYIVPRCYIGDRPPLPSDLPAGCTLDDVRVIP